MPMQMSVFHFTFLSNLLAVISYMQLLTFKGQYFEISNIHFNSKLSSIKQPPTSKTSFSVSRLATYARSDCI